MANRRAKSRKELKGLGADELKAKARDLQAHLFQLRMQFKTGQLGSTAMLKLARSEIARAKTLLTQKTQEARK